MVLIRVIVAFYSLALVWCRGRRSPSADCLQQLVMCLVSTLPPVGYVAVDAVAAVAFAVGSVTAGAVVGQLLLLLAPR